MSVKPWKGENFGTLNSDSLPLSPSVFPPCNVDHTGWQALNCVHSKEFFLHYIFSGVYKKKNSVTFQKWHRVANDTNNESSQTII